MNMKKTLFSIAGLVLVVTALVVSTQVRAEERPNINQHRDNHMDRDFNPNNELSKNSCGTHLGNPVIDVTQKVQNDADSGVAGNYWAFDYYSRSIKVWATPAANTYCAIVTYDGNFYTVPGQVGPGNNPVGAQINTSTNQPVNGAFSGGRRALIVGTLLPPPLLPTHGSIGATNYQCDISGNCPGAFSWPDKYFTTGYTYNDDWWGWQYLAGSHGTWINAI